MFKNYLKVAIRSILKNRVYSMINVFGLTLGITSFILIVLWVKDELTYNKHHQNLASIFRVMEFQILADRVATTQSTPGVLAPHIKENFPEVQYATRFTWNEETLIEVDNKSYYETTKYVGPDFLKIFTFDFVSGDPNTALNDKYSVLISKALAKKLFGDKDPIGRLIKARNERNLKVTAVFEPWPENSTFSGFGALMSVEDFVERRTWAAQWGNNNLRTVITLHDPAKYKEFDAKIKNIIREQVEGYEIDLWLQPFTETHLYNNYDNGKQSGGRILYVQIFSIIAFFILMIACINFMNLATAQAAKRAKEVGLRKVVGAFKKHLVFQFLSESLLFAIISGIIALLLTWVLMPLFNEVADKQISFSLDAFTFSVLAGTVLFTGFLAGSYPAFFIARYRPVNVLKGQISSGKSATGFRKGLVVVQFLLSIIMIFSTIAVFQQLEFVQSQETGFDKSGLIYMDMNQNMRGKYDVIKERMKNDPKIENVTAMAFPPLRFGNSTWGVEWPGKDPQDKILFTTISVDNTYIETMGLEMVVGRSFDEQYVTDTSNFMVNEIAAQKMGFTPEEAVNQTITLWDDNVGKIVGVMKDFNYSSSHTEIRPLLLIHDPSWYYYLVVRSTGENIPHAIDALEEISNEFAPDYPFDYKFVDEDWASFYEAEVRTGKLFNGFAIITIFIASLGLFGLSAFTVQQRTKEIGVRKVLGASLSSIINLVSKDFILLVAIAAVIGTPIAWHYMDLWLEDFAFRIEISFLIPLFATGIVLAIALLTVLYHSLRAARTNPVNALRYE
ncbi:MAG: ABC transporter permease [Cyclobacteriaceae bacterium]